MHFLSFPRVAAARGIPIPLPPVQKSTVSGAALEPPLHRLEACAAENTQAGLQRHSLKIGGDCNRIKQVTLSPVRGVSTFGADDVVRCYSGASPPFVRGRPASSFAERGSF